jgi:hypothetical protein
MSSEPKRGVAITAMALFGALSLYVLSVGPVVRLSDSNKLPSTFIKIYNPLFWVAHNTGLEEPLVRYVAWWLRNSN